MYDERSLERNIIRELEKLGWRYVSPDDADRMRPDLDCPFLESVLRDAIRRINRDVELSDSDIDHVLLVLRTISSDVEGVARFLYYLKNGIVVPVGERGERRTIRIFDFDDVENNVFIVTNQFRFRGLRGSVRFDIVLFVNGVPLVVIECKSPVREEVSWVDAYKDIKNYEWKAPEFFRFVQFSIVTDGAKTKYFPNFFADEDKDFICEWKDPYPYNKADFERDGYLDVLRTTIYGLLDRANLLDIIENFIFMRKKGDRYEKIMARYMQFRAANKIYKRVLDWIARRVDKRLGLVWHWQGSGKTYTMAFAAWKLHRSKEAQNPTVFVVVDRIKIEEQIEEDFKFIEVPLERISSIRELIDIITWGGTGKRGIFLTTIEKFRPKEFSELDKERGKISIGRRNVVVLVDEAHRTQYGKFATLMRSVFENAAIFGFSGTPLSKEERNTFQKFCPPGEHYLDRYSMLDSINDGYTVPIDYQAMLPKYHLDREQLRVLAEFEEEEIKKLSAEEKRLLSRRIRALKRIIKKPERIRAIVRSIVEHFKNVVEPTGLKAMIVAVDREACVLYKKVLDELLPEDLSEIVMTFQAKESIKDIREYKFRLKKKHGHMRIKDIHKKIIEDFRNKDKPKILIVTSMLLTGFDAPNLWVMYLDKPLKEHRLLQAIARTNRPLKGKKFGMIIDFIGILKDLEKAFAKYEADINELRFVVRDLQREFELFEDKLQEVLNIFVEAGINVDGLYKDISPALDALADSEMGRDFELRMKELMKLYEMLSGEPFLRPYLRVYTLLCKLYVAYYKRYKRIDVDELKIERLSRKTAMLIQKSIDVRGIEKKYPVVKLDDLIKTLRINPPRDYGSAIDLASSLVYRIRTHTISRFDLRLLEKVQRIYEDLRTRRIKTEEAFRELLEIAREFKKILDKEKELKEGRYLIFVAIKRVFPDFSDELATEITNNLCDHLEKNDLLFHNWHLNERVRRKVLAEIRLFLISKMKSIYRKQKRKIDELQERIFNALVVLHENKSTR